MQGLVQYVTFNVCLGVVGQMQQMNFFRTTADRSSDSTRHYLSKCLAQVGRQELNTPNLGGRIIPVAVINYPPFLEMLKEGKGPSSGAVAGKGMSWELMMALASYFNFTPKPLVADHNIIGLRDKEGQWMGAIDLLEQEKAELTLLPVTMTDARQEAVDFSFLLGTTTFGILVKRPGYTPKPDALLRPFTQEVWWWILGATMVMGPLIYFIIVIRVRLCKGDPTLTRIFPFDQCVWFVYGAMMKQGSMLKPISDSSRILFATWWLFIMIVTSFYTANLTAFLTFNGLKLPIQKVGDLRASDDLIWVAFKDGALVEIISTHPKLKILRDLQAEGRGRFVESREEAVSLVRTNNYVYIDDMQVLDHLIQEDFKQQRRKKENETCSFYTAPLLTDKDFTFWYGYGFKKNSQYTELFNGFFRRLSFFGILNFLHNNATSSSPVCTLPKGFKDRRLQNKDLLTTYVLGFAGIVSSFIVLGCEFALRRRHNKKRTKHTHAGRPPSTGTKVASLNIQNLDWSSNLPPLPNSRPRTPFELRYPQYVRGYDPRGDHYGRETVQGSRSHPRHNSQRMENMVLEARRNPFLIPGKINNLSVLWDQRSSKLILQDVTKLSGNVAYVDGVPYAVMQYKDKDGLKMQKMILSDLI